MIQVRPEAETDHAAIRAVIERAFDSPAEADLVDRLRAAGKTPISLVAVDDGRVLGHILFSPITIANSPAAFRGAGLAPMSVLPGFQSRGIGSRLVREGLAACKEAGYDLVVVLGHAAYYPRFGFVRASDCGLDNEYGAADAFMVAELKEGALKSVGGLVRFAREFQEAGC